MANSAADAIGQWFNAGGMIQFYDFPLEVFLNVSLRQSQIQTTLLTRPCNNGFQATKDLVANGTVLLETLQSHVRQILSVKWDLGLFNDPMIPSDMDSMKIVREHQDLTLEAAGKSIVLLKNANQTLPLRPGPQHISKIALIGPFADVVNYGDYSGQWGQYPLANASTIRQGILKHLKAHPGVDLLSSWGANSWEYNAQNAIPPYLLSVDGIPGGLLATYYANTNFTDARLRRTETPALDWGMYPPPGLPSNNFSATWEGTLRSPVDADVDGWIGVAISPHTTVRLFVNGSLLAASDISYQGTIMGNIMPLRFARANGTQPPTGSAPFTFRQGEAYEIRIEYQTFVAHPLMENQRSLNSQVLLFWNLVGGRDDASAVEQAIAAAEQSDLIILAVGAAWSSDGENADRDTLGLPPSQDALAQAMFATGKPVVMVLQGGRPWATTLHYERAAAVVSAFFPGQSGGQAIADVLFGTINPGGRMPFTVPRHVGQLPLTYNYKPSARVPRYVDGDSSPYYPFGFGLSYSSFEVAEFHAFVRGNGGLAVNEKQSVERTFAAGDTITFSARVKNTGSLDGSHVLQVYLLGRVSAITQPVRRLVQFRRVYLEAGEETVSLMDLDVSRYLQILNRKYEWELEKGEYTFAALEHGGDEAMAGVNITMRCV